MRFLTMLMFPLLLLMTAPSLACSALESTAKQTAHDLVDCTTSKAREAIDQYGGVVDAALELATDGSGHVDKGKLLDSAKNFAIDTGGCVLADAIARALSSHSDDPNAPKSSPLDADPVALRQAFEQLKAEKYGGKSFQTPHGTL
jgi:hypothetical protein